LLSIKEIPPAVFYPSVSSIRRAYSPQAANSIINMMNKPKIFHLPVMFLAPFYGMLQIKNQISPFLLYPGQHRRSLRANKKRKGRRWKIPLGPSKR
jgi:hypothetical protein